MVRNGSATPDPPVFDDAILREMYIEYNIPCDTLVSDPEKLLSFTGDYAGRAGQQVEPEDLSRRLLNLRKLGEAKGGLPRIRRGYRGRN